MPLAQLPGAGRVIAAGRNQAVLDQLPAAATVTLGGAGDAAALAEAAGTDGIHVIIDYLWGPPTEAAIAAITRHGLAHAAPRVRLVEVGQMAGPTIALPAEVPRSSGLEVLGSGPGTIPSPRSSPPSRRSWPSPPAATCRSILTKSPSLRSRQRGGGRRIVLRP